MTEREQLIADIQRRFNLRNDNGHDHGLTNLDVQIILDELERLKRENEHLRKLCDRRAEEIKRSEQEAINRFLTQMRIMASTGNGIGKSTVEKIRQFAIREGFLNKPEPPEEANEK